MNIVYKRAFKIAKAIVDLMGNAPIKNCQILDDPNSKAEVNLFKDLKYFMHNLNQKRAIEFKEKIFKA